MSDHSINIGSLEGVLGQDRTEHRSLSTIAREIRSDWKNVNYAAEPYLEAMECLDSIYDKYGFEDGVFIVLYFLDNARTWRGEVARDTKKELNQMVKDHNAGKGKK